MFFHVAACNEGLSSSEKVEHDFIDHMCGDPIFSPVFCFGIHCSPLPFKLIDCYYFQYRSDVLKLWAD